MIKSIGFFNLKLIVGLICILSVSSESATDDYGYHYDEIEIDSYDDEMEIDSYDDEADNYDYAYEIDIECEEGYDCNEILRPKLEYYRPSTPGWKAINQRRFKQVASVDDYQDRINLLKVRENIFFRTYE